MPDRFFEDYSRTINVRDYGALGNGATDDTAAIQAAFTAAFGAVDSPHGVTNRTQNLRVYFPTGQYIVSSPAAISVTGAVSNGGKVQLTVASTANLKSNYIVNVASVGGVSAATGTWGITVDSPTQITLRGSTFSGTYTSGGTVTTSALHLAGIQGGHIFGSGRLATQIHDTSGRGCLWINGMGYSKIELLHFSMFGTAQTLVDLNWDAGQISPVSTQSNTIADCFFENGKYGLAIGVNGAQSSETLVLNSYFINCGTAAITTGNQNCLGHSIIGGNIAGCPIGINIGAGAISLISGVHFQNNPNTYDINILNSSGDTCAITGCRSESLNFASIHAGCGVTISGCSQINSSLGTFIFYEGGVNNANGCVIDGCYSVNGTMDAFSNGRIYIRGSTFDTATFIPSNCNAQIAEYSSGPQAVSTLPTAITALKGVRRTVTDSSVTTFGSTVSAGGSTLVPVYCDGTNWKVG